jgi:hypothetical protein
MAKEKKKEKKNLSFGESRLKFIEEKKKKNERDKKS